MREKSAAPRVGGRKACRPARAEAETETETQESPTRERPASHDLIRSLIGAADANGPSSGVLLDMDVDGVRCLLVRSEAPVTQAALSPREIEIARMVASGHPNKVIAKILEISQWTVCTHLRRIFDKLGVHSRAAMVAALPEHSALSRSLATLSGAASGPVRTSARASAPTPALARRPGRQAQCSAASSMRSSPVAMRAR